MIHHLDAVPLTRELERVNMPPHLRTLILTGETSFTRNGHTYCLRGHQPQATPTRRTPTQPAPTRRTPTQPTQPKAVDAGKRLADRIRAKARKEIAK